MPDIEQVDTDSQTDDLLAQSSQRTKEQAEKQNQQNKQGSDNAAASGRALVERKSQLQSYHKGGIVAKTGPALLHKGEIVIPAGRNSDYRRVYQKRKNNRG